MEPWNAPGLEFDAHTFSGTARLFPLPNLVMYPHVMQPLHIFEERYREMTADALASDRLIAMSMLEPGWETDYDSRPPVSQFACLGKIVAHHRLDDGRYNLLLLGVQRVRILQELDPLRAFRQAQVDLLVDRYDFETKQQRRALQETLIAAFREHLPCACQLPEQIEELLAKKLPLGPLTDLAAYALPLATDLKLELLGECRVRRRAEILLDEVRSMGALAAPPKQRVYPPSFSDN